MFKIIFTDDEHHQMTKMQKLNTTLMMMPRKINMGMDQEIKSPPEIIDLEEVIEITGKIGSPNSILSSGTGKRLGGFSAESDDEDGGNGGGEGGERKKLRLTKEQIVVLEQAFKEHTTLNTVSCLFLSSIFYFHFFILVISLDIVIKFGHCHVNFKLFYILHYSEML